MTGQIGNRRATTTDSSGYYRFENVKPGQIYVISIFARGYVFRPSTKALMIYREASLGYSVNFTADN